MIHTHFAAKTNPVACKENQIFFRDYRITVLSPLLFRVEEEKEKNFCDSATQIVWFRHMGPNIFTTDVDKDRLMIDTGLVQLVMKPEWENSYICFRDGKKIKLSNDGNLFGTYRTLDCCDGDYWVPFSGEWEKGHRISLEYGVVSKSGVALLDDSNSLLLCEDGTIIPRETPEKDIYIFAYGMDYRGAVQALFQICGEPPILPRFALGNWWSRYYDYTQDEYIGLMDSFEERDIPFTVATVDMDWHWSENLPDNLNGWTGYSWNTELFPDYKEFLRELHRRNYHITLNLHPADGVRYFEDSYEEMAKRLGINPESKQPVAFDLSNPDFVNAYFDVLHKPYERDGVDFWWIDWQQGVSSKVEGLDPLWMLNHYHYLDNGRDGKRPMTFSRYAGPGSHRYPVGFSGDTIVSWKSLAFQPYFTASASNIGYGMWSHDIGGHMMGVRDDELCGRWVQFGVFSPIMRLHSTNSMFNSKEPWRYRPEICAMMEEFLRLRHKMLPYLYTMNYRQYAELIPLILPMYYSYPNARAAYQVPNQYLFGSQLMVAAITTPCLKGLNMAKTTVWFPEGRWYDIFTGLCYEGGRMMNLYRDINSIPVFAKAGAIVPFQEEYGINAGENPQKLHLYLYAGADGSFTLYEDDNTTNGYRDGRCVKTKYSWQEEAGSLCIHRAEGELSLIPERRDYILTFCGITQAEVSCDLIKKAAEGKVVSVGQDDLGRLEIRLEQVPVTENVAICLQARSMADNEVVDRCFRILDQAQIEMMVKENAFHVVDTQKDTARLLGGLLALELDNDLYGALAEIVSA